MYRLVPTLIALMGDAYPELKRAQALITETLKNEEQRFKKTLDRGLKLLDEETESLKPGQSLSGDTAFKLYDTFGFPVDLTADALRAKNMGVDMAAFEAAMKKQKETARASWVGTGDATNEKLWFDLADDIGPTEFLGYDSEKAEGQITPILKYGTATGSAQSGESVFIVVNLTPFYAESGGQVGDTGLIVGPNGEGAVTDTLKKAGKIFAHQVTVTKGTLKKGEGVELKVDHARRANIRAHHSVTHLLHEALRQTLGDHVAQKGSLQSADRTRFDFAQPNAITLDQLKKIEADVNREILANTEVMTRVMGIEEAMETGARALFGEKYGDEVRVVSMGAPIAGANKPWSIELCGGTHVGRTGDIGLIRIVGESASAAGVRRIEAITADGARGYLAAQDERVRELASLMRTRPEDVVDRVKTLLDERKVLERQLADAKRQIALGGGGTTSDSAGDGVRTVGSVKLLARSVQGLNPKDLRGLIDESKKRVGSGIVAIVGVTEDGKAGLAVGVTDDLTKTWNAVELVKIGAEALGGKGGGGRPDMAQAGGPDGTKASAALEAIEARLSA
jgi:alanyl-tRNA synthetase